MAGGCDSGMGQTGGVRLFTGNLCMSSRGGCVSLAVPLGCSGAAIALAAVLVSPGFRWLLFGPTPLTALCVAYVVAGACSSFGNAWGAAVATASLLDMLAGPCWLARSLAALGYLFLCMAPTAQLLTCALRRVRPTWFYDALEERLQHFCNSVLRDPYDVVCLQELTTFYGLDSVTSDVRKAAAKQGLDHFAWCGRWPSWPSTFLSSGLVVLSRHPITKSKHVTFGRQAWFEWNMIQRGALMVEVQLPNGKKMAVLNTHTTCGMQVVQAGTGVGAGDHLENVMGLSQLQSVVEEFRVFSEGSDHKVFCGDFNVHKTSASFGQLREELSNRLELKDCFPQCPPTFGCDDDHAETMLTPAAERRVPRIFDHVFSDMGCAEVGIDEMRAPEELLGKFQQVSDHRAIYAALHG